MRRKDRETDRETALRLIDGTDYCVIATVDANGQPYAVPVNAARSGDAFYFHTATEGRKNDAFRFCGRVSMVFVNGHRVIPEKYTTAYSSAIVQGRIREITDTDEKIQALLLICRRFAPSEQGAAEVAQSAVGRTAIWCVEAEEITGKRNPGNSGQRVV